MGEKGGGASVRGDLFLDLFKVSKGAKIMNRYNQEPHLTQDIPVVYSASTHM